VKKLGGEVAGLSFLIELLFLNGRSRFPDYPITALVQF
jgi:adenine phosphoribosyltransferase